MQSSIVVLHDIDIPNNLKSIELIKSINLLSEYPKAKKGLTPFFFIIMDAVIIPKLCVSDWGKTKRIGGPLKSK